MSFHFGSGGSPEPSSFGRILQEFNRAANEVFGVLGNHQLLIMLERKSFRAAMSGDDGSFHRHGFQNLATQSCPTNDGSDKDSTLLQIGSYIRDMINKSDRIFLAIGQNFGWSVTADDRNFDPRNLPRYF